MPPPVSASVLNEVSPLDIFLRDFPNIERHGASPIQEQASEVIMREGETYPLIEFQNIDMAINGIIKYWFEIADEKTTVDIQIDLTKVQVEMDENPRKRNPTFSFLRIW